MAYRRLITAVFIGALALAGVGCARNGRILQPEPVAPPAPQAVKQLPPADVADAPTPPQPTLPTPPSTPHRITVLPVPFTVQAPHANWELPYQEACEEASMIMVAEFFSGRKELRLAPDEADQLILQLVAWETDHGFPMDVTAAEVVSILGQRFGIQSKLVPYDEALLRSELTAKHPVILPAAGRALGNPFFKQPGPLYHMLVVKGYEGDEFIVNDPGTRRGESYRYHKSAFTRAVHDWNGGEVDYGSPVMIVVEGLRKK